MLPRAAWMLEIWCVASELQHGAAAARTLCAELWADARPVGRTRWQEYRYGQPTFWQERLQVPSSALVLTFRTLGGDGATGRCEAALGEVCFGEGRVDLQAFLRQQVSGQRSCIPLVLGQATVGRLFFEMHLDLSASFAIAPVGAGALGMLPTPPMSHPLPLPLGVACSAPSRAPFPVPYRGPPPQQSPPRPGLHNGAVHRQPPPRILEPPADQQALLQLGLQQPSQPHGPGRPALEVGQRRDEEPLLRPRERSPSSEGSPGGRSGGFARSIVGRLICRGGCGGGAVAEPEVASSPSQARTPSGKVSPARSIRTPRILKASSKETHLSKESVRSDNTRLAISERGQEDLNTLMHSKDRLRMLAERPFLVRCLPPGSRLSFEDFQSSLTELLLELDVRVPQQAQMQALFDKHSREVDGMNVENYEAMLFRLLCFLRASEEVRIQKRDRTLSGERDRHWREEFIQKNPLRFTEVYQMGRQLGKGSFGVCYMVRHQVDPNGTSQRVCKIISKAKARDAKTPPEKVREEFAVLKQLDHPHVLRIFEDFEDEDNFYVVMEECKGGDLAQYIRQLPPMDAITYERWAGKVMQHTLAAIAYCHAKGIIHKDLKPENVMMLTDRETPWHQMHVVVVDFGLAEVFSNPADRSAIISGTPPYMAPEVWRGNFTKSCDLWSAGVMLFFLLSGRLPFVAREVKEFPQVIMKEPDWELMGGATPEAQAFCSKLLQKQEVDRINAQEALADRWFETMGLVGGTAASALDQAQIKALLTAGTRTEFEKFVTRFVATQVDASGQARVNEAFRALDADHDGLLSLQELREGLKAFGASAKVAEEAALALDVGKTGSVSYTEFLAGLISLRHKQPEEQDRLLMIAWQQFRPDGEGRVKANSIQDALATRGMTVADLPDGFIDALKSKSSESLSFAEFKDVLLKDSTGDVVKTLCGEKVRGAKLLRWVMKFMS